MLAGPRPTPGGTLGFVTKLNCLSMLTSGNPQMYASVAKSSGLFDDKSCAVFTFNSSIADLGLAALGCACA